MKNPTVYSTASVKDIPQFLEEIDNLNESDSGGLSPLHRFCAANDSAEVIRLVLRAGADPQARTEGGLTPLHAAAAYNSNPEIAKTLIECGAVANARSRVGLTPVFGAAAFNDNPGVVLELIQGGCRLSSISESKMNPLFGAAAFNSNPEIVTVLLDNGIEVDKRDRNKATALHFAAAFNSNTDVAKTLIERGAEVDAVDSAGLSPLHLAARSNPEPGMILLLVDKGATVGLQAADGKTAMDIAKASNVAVVKSNAFSVLRSVHKSNWGSESFFSRATPEDVKSCLAAGAKINADSGSKSLSPLHWAVRYTRHLEVIEMMLEHSASVNFSDGIGQTPLHWAVRNQHIARDIVKLLIDRGAILDSRTRNDDATPLRSAARYANDVEILRLMIAGGADVEDVTRKGATMVHSAVRNDRQLVEVVQFFLSHEQDINAADNFGMTPLHYAVRYNRMPNQIKFLIKSGADPGKTSSGHPPRRPIDLATKSSRKTIAKLFPTPVKSARKSRTRTPAGQPDKPSGEAKSQVPDAPDKAKARAANQRAAKSEPQVLQPEKPDNDAAVSNNTVDRSWGNPDYFSHTTLEDIAGQLEAGASISKPWDTSRRTPLHLAARDCKEIEAIRLLVGHGADLAARDNNGMTALHFAVGNPAIAAAIAEVLIDSGADIGTRTKRDGATPLRAAVKNASRLDVVTMLIDRGAPVDDHSNQGVPLLHSAARNPNIAPIVIQELLDRNADITEQDRAGNNILHVAMRVRSPRSTIEYLLNAGVDPGIKNSRGKKPTEVGPPSLRKALSQLAAARQHGTNPPRHAEQDETAEAPEKD